MNVVIQKLSAAARTES